MTPSTDDDLLTLLTGFSLILAGSVLFSRSAEQLVENLFRGHPLGMRILGILSLSLPEAILPLMAFRTPADGLSHPPDSSLDIGVGAILGAPSFLLLLLWPLYLVRTRGQTSARPGQLRREIPLLAFALAFALAAGKTPSPRLHLLTAGLLLGLFGVSLLTLHPDPETPRDPALALPFRPFREIALFLTASFLIIAGPRIFLSGLFAWQQAHPGPAPFWISMVLSALATESPEALALLLLLRKGERNHGFDIVWGAIGFQLTVPPAIGLALSPWILTARHYTMGFLLLAVLFASWFTAGKKP
ncbi:MAG: hypothetical protein M1297_10050 [Nitrospirae bacterium]|jgi:cation:H+ antiporter|nr:hypothetical protein [Nitrospirota bacterium]